MVLESQKVLDAKGVPYRLIRLSGKAISCEDVVKFAIDEVKPGEICKTIVVKDKAGNSFAFLLRGNHKVDFSKAKQILGKKVSIVSYDDLVKSTGVEPGAVCPLLLKIPIFVDRNVFACEKINFGSGDHLFGIEMSPRDLERAVSFKTVDVAQ